MTQPLDPPQTWLWDIAFLDRDGTLNQLRPGYRTLADFALFDEALRCTVQLGQLARHVIVVTNQRGLATGVLSATELTQVHERLQAEVQQRGGRLDEILVCPHQEGECGCRKPRPGLLQRALQNHPDARPAHCVMFGDTSSDADAAAAVGVPFVRVDPTVGLTEQNLRMTVRAARVRMPLD